MIVISRNNQTFNIHNGPLGKFGRQLLANKHKLTWTLGIDILRRESDSEAARYGPRAYVSRCFPGTREQSIVDLLFLPWVTRQLRNCQELSG